MEIKLSILGMLFAPLVIPVTGWLLASAFQALRSAATGVDRHVASLPGEVQSAWHHPPVIDNPVRDFQLDPLKDTQQSTDY